MNISIGVLAVLVLVYLFLIMPGFRKKTSLAFLKGRLYAHRGLFDNAGAYPENSMKAFERAVQAGYGIETDIQMTKDGRVVCIHDFTLQRVVRDEAGNPVKGNVRDYTYEELQEFHILESEEKIPLFEDFLKRVNGRVPLIIELKIENSDTTLQVCEEGNRLLSEYNGPYCIESFNPRGVRWYKQHRPDIIRGQLSDNFGKDGYHGLVFFVCKYLMLNFLTKPDFVAYNAKYADNLSRRICHGLYRNTAVAWTIRSEEELKRNREKFDLFIFEGFIPNEKQ